MAAKNRTKYLLAICFLFLGIATYTTYNSTQETEIIPPISHSIIESANQNDELKQLANEYYELLQRANTLSLQASQAAEDGNFETAENLHREANLALSAALSSEWYTMEKARTVALGSNQSLKDESSSSEKEPKYVHFFPSYATNREFDGKGFTGKISKNISYGFCNVSIPVKIHETGEIERPVNRWWWFNETEDPEKHFILKEIHPLEKESFLSNLSSSSLLLFIHGFNVTFEGAALRTAQLHYDLKFQGRSMFFSWASDGSINGYVNDSTKISDSVGDIKEFIKDLSNRDEVEEIFIIAHSMGSRGITRALTSLKDDLDGSSLNKLRELILVEPDISQEVFKARIAPELKKLGARISIYASKNDKALGISRPINNGTPRLGQAGKHLYISDGFETIDSSDVGVSFLRLNHSSYAENLEFILELSNVIDGKKADSRPGLKKKEGYWYLIPAK
ncbi:alpha/beta hydrolase [Porticoccus sp. W117]|uniref:alpha/beta hydrolase n=1 Tax=Porticoccus sp. W117 TaxID=3054777 RepID=UPI0025929490|nr:alpha/beta hydrolase [Porticoccus sp. W117]MDM3872560.1 alpha/beta hydrolase [Porticoccus sp. W117]